MKANLVVQTLHLLLFALPFWSLGCGRKAVLDSRDVTADAARADAPPQADAAIGDGWFVDATDQAGIRFEHRRGPMRHWLPEIMCGGAVWFDYDADGDPDLYLVQGGDLAQEGNLPGNVLYQNNGDGTFVDVTELAGVGDTRYGMGGTAGDFDGDGHVDLYVTNVGPNVLYRNNGDGTFADVSDRAGVADSGWGTAASFMDYDNDGRLDLFLVNYVRWSPELESDCRTNDNVRDYCSPLTYQAPAMDVLFRNQGDGTFENVTLETGIAKAYGNGLGAVVGDFDSDGRIDIYVANDGTPNQLWMQLQPGKFRDKSLELGCSVNGIGAAEAGMGVAAFDLENDGDLDLFMTHLGNETNTLYVNQGQYFEDRSANSKLGAASFAYTGFGLAVADFDHDGQVDLYVANGRVGRNSAAIVEEDIFAEPNQVFRGEGDGRFAELARERRQPDGEIANSRAVAMADYDLDGDIDLLIVNNNGKARLLSNRIGDGQGAVRVSVEDRIGRPAIGATVGLRVGSKIQWRVVAASAGYLAGHEPQLHFGMWDGAQIEEMQIIWPDGQRETREFSPKVRKER